MDIWKRLAPGHIFLNIDLPDKAAVLRFAAQSFFRAGLVTDPDALLAGFVDRESVMSTGIGGGIGIPHAFSPDAAASGLLLLRLARPIDFSALDGRAVDVVLPLVAPEGQTHLHLQMLARISRLLKNESLLLLLRATPDADTLCAAIRRSEEAIAPRS